jgi:hypothetical protein
MRACLAVFCLLAATACSETSPLGPSVARGERVTLARGEVRPIEGTGLRIQFVGVSGDSRCPADAVCIQGGDAIVQIRVADGAALHSYELHTGDSARASARHDGVTIELLELQPYPFSSRTIEQDDYEATLVLR